MASATCMEIKRHYTPLGEKETEEVIGIVADMLVGFMKRGMPGGQSKTAEGTESRTKQGASNRRDAPVIPQGEAHGPQH